MDRSELESTNSTKSRPKKFFSKFWNHCLARPLEVLGFIIALGALGIAWHELTKVDKILSGISTRPARDFPNNQTDIHSIFSEAQDSMTIMLDQPLYGAFSNQDLFSSFFDDIKAKLSSSKEFKLKLVFPNSIFRNEMRRKQFNVDSVSQPLDSIHGFVYKHKLKKFVDLIKDESVFNGYDPPDTSFIKTYKNLEDLFDTTSKIFLTQLTKLGKRGRLIINTTASNININCWLADDDKLLFTLITYGKKTEEYSFYSKDKGFINVAKESYQNLLSACDHAITN